MQNFSFKFPVILFFVFFISIGCGGDSGSKSTQHSVMEETGTDDTAGETVPQTTDGFKQNMTSLQNQGKIRSDSIEYVFPESESRHNVTISYHYDSDTDYLPNHVSLDADEDGQAEQTNYYIYNSAGEVKEESVYIQGDVLLEKTKKDYDYQNNIVVSKQYPNGGSVCSYGSRSTRDINDNTIQEEFDYNGDGVYDFTLAVVLTYKTSDTYPDEIETSEYTTSGGVTKRDKYFYNAYFNEERIESYSDDVLERTTTCTYSQEGDVLTVTVKESDQTSTKIFTYKLLP